MSEFNSFHSIPIINTLSNSGQPLIVGISTIKTTKQNKEIVSVEVHRIVPLADLEDEDEGEECEIDLKVEELVDRLDTINEDQHEDEEEIIENNNEEIKSIECDIPIIKIAEEKEFKLKEEKEEELNKKELNIIENKIAEEIISEMFKTEEKENNLIIEIKINNSDRLSTFLIEKVLLENNNVYIEPFLIEDLRNEHKELNNEIIKKEKITNSINNEKQQIILNEKEKLNNIKLIENNKLAAEIELCKMVEELKALQQIEEEEENNLKNILIKKEEQQKINEIKNNIKIIPIEKENIKIKKELISTNIPIKIEIKKQKLFQFPFSSSNNIINKSSTLPKHSPFGKQKEEKEEEEDFRLSPKTLCRIKKLNIVMDGCDRIINEEEKDSADVIHHHPIFVKDTSRFWYKPKISREEAISMLKNKPPGTFVVRDSNSFPGAFGLALKVSQPPVGVAPADGSELVRHFLIEPSPKGVRLKGCSNEPVFGTLAALVYQHSITPLALPCRLILSSIDPATTTESINSNQALLERGAACNVTYLCSVDTESLTGPEAVRRSTAFVLKLLLRNELRAVPIHIKVSLQGITLTDNTRTLFFRRHYPVNSVTFAGIDPENRVFDNNNVIQLPPTYVRQAPMFGFVAHKNSINGFNGNIENSCHMFAELDPDQPASAVVRFITNVMMPAGRVQLQQKHQQNN
ncbi:hypothetical protein ACQ4LE_001072 [Meloidogyne hapla]